MAARIPDSLERLTHADLIGVVRDLIGEVGRLRAENEKLSGALRKLKVEHQAVKDELARLKNLPPRPPQKPSGMDKATDQGGSGGGKSADGEKSSRRRGSQLDKLTIGATIVVTAKAPAGSRHKGYEDIVVQDLSPEPVSRITHFEGQVIALFDRLPAGTSRAAVESTGSGTGNDASVLRMIRLARLQAAGRDRLRPRQGASVPPCSPPSRCGLAKSEFAARLARRPTLTASARGGELSARSGRRNGFRIEQRNGPKAILVRPFRDHDT
jgi:hypothetical protein